MNKNTMTYEQIQEIYISEPMSLTKLSKKINCSLTKVYEAVHLLDEYAPFKSGRAKLFTKEQGQEMIELHNQGWMIKDIASKFGVTSATVSAYVKQKHSKYERVI